MRILVASIVIAAFGCPSRKQEPIDPLQGLVLPEVTVQVPPPAPKSSRLRVEPGKPRLVVDRGNLEPDKITVREGFDPNTPIEIIAEPSVPYSELITTLDTLRSEGMSSFSLLVRTPFGIGALPVRLPRAIMGDGEPLLVLSIARGEKGEPRLFLGARSIEMNELAPALRESSRKRLVLDVDRATTVGTFANVLAAATTAQLDVMLMTKAVAPEPPHPVPRKSAIQSKP